MKRRCIEAGCPNLTTRTRFPEHQRQQQFARGYTSEYRAAHAKRRAAWTPEVATPTQRRESASAGQNEAELLGLVERLLAEQRRTNELLEMMLSR